MLEARLKWGSHVGVNCYWTKCAFVVRSAPRAASSTAAASRSVSLLSVASQKHSVVVVAAAAGLIVVTGVAAPPWLESVTEGHKDKIILHLMKECRW